MSSCLLLIIGFVLAKGKKREARIIEPVAFASQVYVTFIDELRVMLGWTIRDIKCSVPQKHK